MEEEISVLDEVKKNLKTKKLIYGTDRTMKALKTGKISKIFVSSNAPKEIADDLDHYQKLTGVHLIKIDLKNDELGIYCKKTYSVSVLGLLK